MLGAITGDIIGSIYEINNIKTKSFELLNPDCFFTDDTVLTVALANSILTQRDYGQVMRHYFKRYSGKGFGQSFRQWAHSENATAYNSWGNGSAMRTSSVGFAFNTLEEVLENAKYYASFTHNHPEGIKGAQATASAIFLARTGASKEDIRAYITKKFNYNLSKSIDEIRPTYTCEISCQGTVPQAITAFLDSTNFEDAINQSRCLLEFLPAYSPDLNPIEHKWAQAKSIRRKQRCTVNELFTEYI